MISQVAQHGDRSGSTGRGWLLSLVLVSLLGLVAAVCLSVLHWQVHNQPGHVSFCAVSESMNCDTVSLSSFSSVLGVPVSTWAVLFFIGILILGVWGIRSDRALWPWGLLGALFSVAAGSSTLLFLISHFVLETFCLMCLALYMVNMASCVLCVLGLRQAGVTAWRAASLFLGALFAGALVFAVCFPKSAFSSWGFLLAAAVMAAAALFSFLRGRGRGRLRLRDGLKQDLALLWQRPLLTGGLALLFAGLAAAVLALTPRLYLDQDSEIAGGVVGMTTGRTPEGHNWIGAERPEVVIVEYSDYECPHCRLAHQVVREVVRERKEWLRLVHVHMPLDHTCNPALRGRPFHRFSCACARGAICADRQDRFWQMNDTLFIRRGGLDAGGLAVLAAEMGLDAEAFRACLRAQDTEARLQADLELCRRLGLKPATPTFSIEGTVIVGSKNKQWWQEAVDRARAGKKVQQR